MEKQFVHRTFINLASVLLGIVLSLRIDDTGTDWNNILRFGLISFGFIITFSTAITIIILLSQLLFGNPEEDITAGPITKIVVICHIIFVIFVSNGPLTMFILWIFGYISLFITKKLFYYKIKQKN